MKELFNEIISNVIKPLLKRDGYHKKGLNFYKKSEDLIFLLNIQKSHGNSSDNVHFYINCGIHSSKIDELLGKGELLEPKEYETHFCQRISSLVNSIEDGYTINAETNIEKLKSEIISDIQTVIDFFETIQFTNHLVELMIQKNGLHNYEQLFTYLTLTNNTEGRKIYVKQLYDRFGQENRWSIFEKNMNDILKKHGCLQTITNLISH